MALAPLFVVLGPTAVGKSALALHLARTFDGEIVSADSRQVFRHMDIATAKPSQEDRSRVPHHLVDVVSPDQEFSLTHFLDLAHRAIQDIHTRGKLPITTGGTGQYIWGLLEGWQVPRVPPDPRLREELEDQARREGRQAVYRKLCEVDGEAASRINPRNLRRVIRALEIYHATGMPPSAVRRKGPSPYRPLIIGLDLDRDALYQKIDRRVDEMMERGLVGEVEELFRMGYSTELASMSSMGYKEIALHLRSGLALEGATQRIKYETHRFVRHQYSWFRRGDPRIQWLHGGTELEAQAEALVRRFLREPNECGRIALSSQESAP